MSPKQIKMAELEILGGGNGCVMKADGSRLSDVIIRQWGCALNTEAGAECFLLFLPLLLALPTLSQGGGGASIP